MTRFMPSIACSTLTLVLLTACADSPTAPNQSPATPTQAAVAQIRTDATTLDLGVGDERLMVATPTDAAGQPLARRLAWSSSDPAVVKVDTTGLVTATGAGTARIVVASEGRSVDVSVTVTGQQWRLLDAGGAALPAPLYQTTVVVDGVTRAATMQVTEGTLRLRNNRFVLRLNGWLTVQGSAPVRHTVNTEGVTAYDLTNGDLMLHEGTEWWNRAPRFRGAYQQDGRMMLGWNQTAGGANVALRFAQ